jgi:hypothetical protein
VMGEELGVHSRTRFYQSPRKESLRESVLRGCHALGLLLVLREIRSCYHPILLQWKSRQTLALQSVLASVPDLWRFADCGDPIDRHSYILGIQALEKERPWLTLGDFELYLQGWFQAEKVLLGTPYTEECDVSLYTKVPSPVTTNAASASHDSDVSSQKTSVSPNLAGDLGIG